MIVSADEAVPFDMLECIVDEVNDLPDTQTLIQGRIGEETPLVHPGLPL